MVWKASILQFGRRFSEVGVVVVLNDNEYFVVVLDFFDEFLHVVFRHPSAENVIVFLIVFHPGRELAHVKVVGKLLQTVPGGDELGRPVGEHLAGLFVQALDLQVHPGDLAPRDWCVRMRAFPRSHL